MKKIKQFLITLFIFLLLDSIYLGFIAKDFIQGQLGSVIPLTLSIGPALIFYVLFIIGLLYFVIHPALAENSVKSAVKRGAFFGLVTYGTYDLTNQATIANWPVIITITDLMWGTFLSATVSSLSFLLIQKLDKKKAA